MTDERNSIHSRTSRTSDVKTDETTEPTSGDQLQLNYKQAKALRAICSTFIGELDETELDQLCQAEVMTSGKKDEKIREFGKLDVSRSDEFFDRIISRLSQSVTSRQLAEIKLLLKRLSSRGVSGYGLTGSTKAFFELDQKQREAIVSKWSTSPSANNRRIFRILSHLVCTLFWSDAHDLYPLIGYPGPDPEAVGPRYRERTFPEYEFVEITNETTELNYDILIIGSGAGGSVIAARMARMTGNSVVVIEKGRHCAQEKLTLDQQDGYKKLYENGGGIFCEDSNTTVLAGSNFGGGTTVGWCAAVEPHHHVREEWARKFGLVNFLEEDFNNTLKTVKNRLGVNENNITHNESNQILVNGCKKIGASVNVIPQNSASKPHPCGWCGFGCKYGEKQGAVMTYLKDAKDFGVNFIQDCFVEKVLTEDGQVIGVEAIANGSRRFKVMAKKVIVACGAVHSPALLLRSGLKNKNIGKNLHIHPTAGVYGVFPKKEIKTYAGTIMTAVCDAEENVDGDHYGSRIVVGSHHPATIPTTFPWRSSLQHKQLMLQYNHIAPLLSITRDKDAGQVKIDSRGMPKLEYKLSTNDAKSVIVGITTGLKILVAAGASRVGTCLAGVEEFEVSDESPLNDPKFESYLEKIRKTGVPEQASIGSIHQMGTWYMMSCAFLVKPTGETWEVKNLYVVDSSVFPTAIGVDPMVREAILLSREET
ncbi:7928_t:CDS:2 [Acaulospora colombiana]|uniref:7928_t:CDS:1 n=1 Tax=Acaulospora colombiana TaxID=27376 RepID=A0ACA9KIJ3_9GLOM|nr:7928_t:CDS:2 [Acaulospora colombiana]